MSNKIPYEAQDQRLWIARDLRLRHDICDLSFWIGDQPMLVDGLWEMGVYGGDFEQLNGRRFPMLFNAHVKPGECKQLFFALVDQIDRLQDMANRMYANPAGNGLDECTGLSDAPNVHRDDHYRHNSMT